jgi:hypothetical protein
MRRSITAILLICLLGLARSGCGPSYGGWGYGDHYGPYWGAGWDHRASWATIPGKTMSSDTHRISTVLQERATSVVSTAVASTAVAFIMVAVAGTGAE